MMALRHHWIIVPFSIESISIVYSLPYWRQVVNSVYLVTSARSRTLTLMTSVIVLVGQVSWRIITFQQVNFEQVNHSWSRNIKWSHTTFGIFLSRIFSLSFHYSFYLLLFLPLFGEAKQKNKYLEFVWDSWESLTLIT